MKLFLSVLTFIVVLPAFAQDEDEGFVVVKSEPPFAVHERWIEFPGSNKSTRELKSAFTVKASIYAIVEFLKDETQIAEWQSHVSMYKIYRKEDVNHWEEYSRHDVPWPVSDQDSFLEYSLTEVKSGEEVLITFKSRIDHNIAPIYEDVNRVQLIGSWRLEQLSTDTVKITYRIQSAPATSLPRIIVDPFIRSNLLASIRSMTELVEK